MTTRKWGHWFDTAARAWRDGAWADRLALGAGMQRAADRLMQDAVDQARAEGASWAQVARVLGISRQSAWERFGEG